MNLAPNEDEIEINIFGPGYGECCVVHVGGGQWIIIDSCVDTESGQAVALAYLEKIGVNPATGVKLIVASHWHDDHIRGMSSVLGACSAARFCASGALNDAVWPLLIEEEAKCVLTPWNRSGTLPTRDDVTRLLNFTIHGYSTSNLATTPKTQRPYTVEKQIRETTRRFRSTHVKTGHVRWRLRIAPVPEPAAIQLSPEACSLAELWNMLKRR